MKRLITETTEEKEVWKCMKCGYKEEFKLWKSNTKGEKK
jgi:lipopolysaccharide biosynthesis regulator YciM